jgi:hypothetical protein
MQPLNMRTQSPLHSSSPHPTISPCPLPLTGSPGSGIFAVRAVAVAYDGHDNGGVELACVGSRRLYVVAAEGFMGGCQGSWERRV